jgi:hypothetical protein
VIRSAVILVVLAALLSACGGSGLRDDLSATGQNIGKIRAGVLDFSMLVTPHAKNASNPFGWKLKGPFAFGNVPTAHVVYTQIANGHSADVTLVMDKSGGYAVVNGKRRSLTDSNLEELRGSAGRVRAGATIDISKWIDSASSCGARCASGALDVAAAANTLLQIAGSTKTLSDAEARQLADATRDASYRVEWTDKHLMRKLKLHLDIGFQAPDKLKAALGELVGAAFDLNLDVQRPQA